MGEIILVQLGNRTSFCELLSEHSNGKRIRVKIGRNKEAKLPLNRVLLHTGTNCKSHDEVISFSTRSHALMDEIDLKIAWEYLSGEEKTLSSRHIAEACGLDKSDPHAIAAVLLCIEEDDTYIHSIDGGFFCRTAESIETRVQKMWEDRERKKEISDLITNLDRNELSPNLTKNQESHLNHIREYAIHGDRYSRSGRAIELLSQIKSGSNESIQIYAYNKLTECGLLDLDYPREIAIAEIPRTFDRNILLEANKLTDDCHLEDEILDLTALDTFTIDDQNTIDRDDAFSVVDETIWIHITDICSLIPKNSKIDSEASSRVATLYTPDITVPMLPPSITEKMGSLDPGQDRRCLSIKLDAIAGESHFDWSIHHTKIRSDKSLSYLQADRILVDPNDPLHQRLSHVREMMRHHETSRVRKGALELNRPQLSIKVLEDKKIEVKVLQKTSPSRSMVAELMIAYNGLIGTYCENNRISVPFRIQSDPEESLPLEMPEGPLKWYSIGKLLRPAKVSTTGGIHSGLGIENYVQSSSPLRRYLDLIVQRQVVEHLHSRPIGYTDSEISTIANVSDSQFRTLRRIENDRIKYWFLKYLNSQYLEGTAANNLKAVILENFEDRPSNFELVDFPYRGKCHFPSTTKPGDQCYLKLNGIDLWHKTAQFSFGGTA